MRKRQIILMFIGLLLVGTVFVPRESLAYIRVYRRFQRTGGPIGLKTDLPEEIGPVKPSSVCHESILLSGNDDLAVFCDIGNGSVENPYIIENFVINAADMHGISLWYTNASVEIRNCTVTTGLSEKNGIHIYGCSNVNITGNTLFENNHGIYALVSSALSISKNNCTANNKSGMYLRNSDTLAVVGNKCTLNGVSGVEVWYNDESAFIGNNCSRNLKDGLHLYFAADCSVFDNNCEDNGEFGIMVGGWDNFFSGNIMINCGFSQVFSSNIIDTTNLVNGKSVYYYEGEVNLRLSGLDTAVEIGQLILRDCTNVVIENFDFSHISVGISMWEVDDAVLSKNNCTYNTRFGIKFSNAVNITLDRNNCSYNGGNGMKMFFSQGGSTITNNFCSFNGQNGIFVEGMGSESISNNNCSINGDNGVYLYGIDYANLLDNDCSFNGRYGFYLDQSNRNYFSGNKYIGNGIADILFDEDSYGNIVKDDFPTASGNLPGYPGYLVVFLTVISVIFGYINRKLNYLRRKS